MVLTAIKKHDLVAIEQFYQAYKITVGHPLRLLIDKLLEPLAEDTNGNDVQYIKDDLTYDIPNKE